MTKVYLIDFFEEIIAIDTAHEAKHKLHCINTIKQNYNLCHDEILFIDCNRTAIATIRDHCSSIFVHEAKGLALRDIENIETHLGLQTTNYSKFTAQIPSSPLSVIDRNIFHEIRNQVNRSKYDGVIDHLDVVQHIENNWHSEPHKEAFLEFAKKYSLMCYHSARFDLWYVHAICETLLSVEPRSSDLNSRMAIAFGYLGDKESCEKYHKRAIRGRFISAYAHYAFFLYKEHRYEESAEIFQIALDINPLNIKSVMGYGRTLSRLDDIEQAE